VAIPLSAEAIAKSRALLSVDGAELRVDLVDSLHVWCKPLVVERAVVGEREGGAAEIREGKVELVPELAFGGVRVG
jgi:hypothetical protein